MIRHFFRNFLNKARDLFSSHRSRTSSGQRNFIGPEIHLDPIIARTHRVRVSKVLRRIRTMQGKTTGDYNER